MKTETEFNRICQEVRMLAKSGHLTNGWNFLILKELRRVNENIEAVLEHTGEALRLCRVTPSHLSNEKVDRKTDAQRRGRGEVWQKHS